MSDNSVLLQTNQTNEFASANSAEWKRLCDLYLPVRFADSIWFFSRNKLETDPPQGWKLHISATVIDACKVLESVAPFLISQNVQFKAPKSLKEVSAINCGLQYGYRQIGKFITVYPASEKQAVLLAEKLHEITRVFFAVTVPFDNQFLPQSSVFYRYGAFDQIEIKDVNGNSIGAIKNNEGKLVADDRFRAVPEWLNDPFQTLSVSQNTQINNSALHTPYKIFRAITQRGKGGTYQAIDFSTEPPRLCVIKEGRKLGEVCWSGQDGFGLVKNEFEILSELRKTYKDAPEIYSHFEAAGNFYLVIENIQGNSLHKLLKFRRRRFSVKQVLIFALEISRVIGELHRAGWIWNDCKPANLFLTSEGKIRPIDFENSFKIGDKAVFNWNTRGFSDNSEENSGGIFNDYYAFGAVLYFLLTGKIYESNKSQPIQKLRRNVPSKLISLVNDLLRGKTKKISAVRKKTLKILASI